jgi:hypothetical protein
MESEHLSEKGLADDTIIYAEQNLNHNSNESSAMIICDDGNLGAVKTDINISQMPIGFGLEHS